MINPIRPGHGTGANGYHVEVPLKDLRPANPADTEAGLADRKRRGRPFEPGNRAAEQRKPTLALLGVAADDVPDLARKDLRRADRYRQRRVREVGVAHGGYVDAGTCAVLGSAALVLASQRQVAALAFKTGDASLHKMAADLAEKHSQLEIKASFLAKDAARERQPSPADLAAQVAQASKPRSAL